MVYGKFCFQDSCCHILNDCLDINSISTAALGNSTESTFTAVYLECEHMLFFWLVQHCLRLKNNSILPINAYCITVRWYSRKRASYTLILHHLTRLTPSRSSSFSYLILLLFVVIFDSLLLLVLTLTFCSSHSGSGLPLPS